MFLQGIFPPITTPFYPDGNVYFKKLEHNVERYSKTPVAGMMVLGSTGEAVMLSDEERREVLKAAREAAAPDKVLIAGTGIESAIETLRLTEYAAELGYDVALIRTPHFYKKVMHPANMLAFYRTVADRSPLPVHDLQRSRIYRIRHSRGGGHRVGGASQYHRDEGIGRRRGENPQDGGSDAACKTCGDSDRDFRCGNSAHAKVVQRQQRTGRGTGAGRGAGRRQTVVCRGERGERNKDAPEGSRFPDPGRPGAEAGAVAAGWSRGGILAFADAAPTACYEIYAAWKEGDAELARLKQERIAKATQRVAGELGIPGLKYGMDLNGYFGGPSRCRYCPDG